MLNLDKLKKYKLPVILMFCAVVLFMVLSLFTGNSKYSQEESYQITEPEQTGNSESYDVYLEEKLEDILSSTEGVGRVKVAVSLVDSGEIYPYTKENSSNENSSEKDSEGGSRDTSSESGSSEPSLIKDSSGSESVVITKSEMPKVSGVIVCAKGGDSYVVKERIINAVKALCNVDINRIEILPMN